MNTMNNGDLTPTERANLLRRINNALPDCQKMQKTRQGTKMNLDFGDYIFTDRGVLKDCHCDLVAYGKKLNVFSEHILLIDRKNTELVVEIPTELAERVEAGDKNFDWGAYLRGLIEEVTN